MKLSRKQIIQTIIFFGLGIFLVYWQIDKLSEDEKNSAIQALKQANYFWVLMAMGIALLSHWVRAIRWTMLINTADEKVKPINSFYAVLIGYFANGFLPRLGEIIRCGVLAKKENVKFEKLLGTVLAERLFDFITLLTIVAITLLIQFDFLFSFINEKLFKPFGNQFKSVFSNLPKLFLGITVIFVLGFLFYKYILQSKMLKAKWESIRHSLAEGFGTIIRLKNKPLFVGYTVMMWTCYFFMSFLIFKSFTQTQHLGVDAGLSVLTSGSLALVIPTPGGLGAYHEFVSRTLGLYDVSNGIGVSLSWLIWLTNLSIVVLGGFLSLILIGLKTNNK